MELLITIVIWAAIFQGLLLGIIFIFSKKHPGFANKLLGFFLISFVFLALADIFPLNEIGGISLSGYFTLPEVKILLPTLFLHFILVKVGRTAFYRLFLKVNYILAFSIMSLTLINLILEIFFNSSLLDQFGWGILEPFFMGYQYYAFTLTVIVFIIALIEAKRYQEIVNNEISDLSLMDIKWLWQFIFVIAPMILLWGAELLRITLGGKGQSELTLFVYICIAIFNYFVSYKAFTHQTLFDGSLENSNRVNKNIRRPINSNKSIDIDTYNEIEKEMETNRYFLDQNLTIHDFAKATLIPARTISTCINQNAKLNFNEWVNNYRVDEAVNLLQNQGKLHLSIEGIGTESGFKSRSAMYAAFQKKLGKSPGNYR